MSSYIAPKRLPAIASAAIVGNRFVDGAGITNNNMTVKQSVVTSTPLGVAVESVASGAEIEVTYTGGALMEAGDAVGAGSPITSDANGKAIVAAAASRFKRGVALTAAAADGDIIEVLIF